MRGLSIPCDVPGQGRIGVLFGNTDLDYGPPLGVLTREQRGHIRKQANSIQLSHWYSGATRDTMEQDSLCSQEASKGSGEADVHQIATQMYNYKL